jgi:hypothetical protein
VFRGSACPACSAVRVGGSRIANNYLERDRYDHPVASLASWRELPRAGRWLVAASAGGAALAGAAGALAVRPDRG